MNTDSIKTLLESYGGENPGCAVVVVQNGKTIFRHISGFADKEENRRVTEQTNFRLASVTKQFTAAGILVLIQEKKLSLDDTLAKFFPDFPAYGKDITVYQLLTHSSGLKEYEELTRDDQTKQIHDEEILELMKRQTETLFPPGTNYDYSNGGYCLLRLVIEIVSEQPIERFLHEKLFLPLGMRSTIVNHEGTTVIENRAYGYSPVSNGQWLRTDQDWTSTTIGDGGIYSSAEDMQKWDRVFYTDAVLKKELRDLMLKKHIHADESRNTFYGFGIFLKEHNGKQIAYHGGSSIGFQAGVYYMLDEELTVVFLSNRLGENGSMTAEQIEDAVMIS